MPEYKIIKTVKAKNLQEALKEKNAIIKEIYEVVQEPKQQGKIGFNLH